MLRANFPGRKNIRRKRALDRLEASILKASGKSRLDQRAEIATLYDRINFAALTA